MMTTSDITSAGALAAILLGPAPSGPAAVLAQGTLSGQSRVQRLSGFPFAGPLHPYSLRTASPTLVQCVASRQYRALWVRPSPDLSAKLPPDEKSSTDMTNTDQERWRRVKERLRSELGEDVFSSWFGRMELEAVEQGRAAAVGADALSAQLDPVALQREGAGAVAGGGAEVTRLELSVRSATIKVATAKPKAAGAHGAVPRAARWHGERRRTRAGVPFMTVHEALGGSPLDPRLNFRDLHRRPLEHACACRGKADRDQPARRAADVQPALHPCRRRARQNPPAAGDHLGRQRQRRPQDALSDRRTVHVRLRLGAEAPRPRSPSRKRCAPSTCW